MDDPLASPVRPFTRRCLIEQGFGAMSDAELRRLEGPLRFTPAVCAGLVLLGLAWRSPLLLLVLGGMGWLAAAHG